MAVQGIGNQCHDISRLGSLFGGADHGPRNNPDIRWINLRQARSSVPSKRSNKAPGKNHAEGGTIHGLRLHYSIPA
jgi:hypothetical protein